MLPWPSHTTGSCKRDQEQHPVGRESLHLPSSDQQKQGISSMHC